MTRTRAARGWTFTALLTIAAGLAEGPALAEKPAADPPLVWVGATRSPLPATSGPARVTELLAHCGRGERGLQAAAERVVARQAAGLAPLDLAALELALRAAGEPHVWPRTLTVAGRSLDQAAALKRMDTWRDAMHEPGERRCGVALGTTPDGTTVLAAIVTFALADLLPLPIRVSIGSWLTLDAHLLVPATEAHVVLQGPAGAPRTVPGHFDPTSGTLRARFTPDRPGPFTAQVVATVAHGPRPVLEARVYADQEPPKTLTEEAAPGEEEDLPGAHATGESPEATLAAMIAAVRAREGVPPLTREARLDALAVAHTQAMVKAGLVGHDVGDGDPSARLFAAGLHARVFAENVAHSQTLALAHRALFESPSHRANLVRRDFTALGVAVAIDAEGTPWVTEVFAAGLAR